MTFPSQTIGVLGGGQLGKMLAQAAADWHQTLDILDASADFPAAPYATNFVAGDFRKAEDVLAFGRARDVVTIEIEHIDTAALYQLQGEGKKVYPQPEVIDIIKDKGRQKEFFRSHGLASSAFRLLADGAAVRQAVAAGEMALPFVQKVRTGGYDGRGVAVIRTAADLNDKLLDGPCLTEDLVPIERELSVITARSPGGEVRAFPCVEMTFDERANLVDLLICPARVADEVAERAEALARAVTEALGIVGLLAVELFLTTDGELLINEVAPRPHNSGHHTIEACSVSQYRLHLHAILGLPLPQPTLRRPWAVLLNLIGAPDSTVGPTQVMGVAEALALPEVYVHLYGKAQCKPFRKMGHVTILADTEAEALAKAEQVRELIRISGVG